MWGNEWYQNRVI